MKKTDFEKILDGKTKLIQLNMTNFKLTSDSGGTLSDYNKVVNDSISKLTSLQYLSLNGLSNITTVDFIEKTRGLLELDLRGTSATDLTKLNTYMTSARCVLIDNTSIDITKVQDLINRANSGSAVDRNFDLVNGIAVSGFYLMNDGLLSQTNKLTRVNNWRYSYAGYFTGVSNGTYDLRNCSGLTFMGFNGGEFGSYYLPTSITEIGWGTPPILNPNELVNLRKKSFAWDKWADAVSLINSVPNLGTIYFYENNSGVNLKQITKPEKIVSLSIYNYAGDQYNPSVTVDNFKGLEKFTNLTTLNCYYNMKLVNFPSEVEKLTNLRSMSFYNTGITNLYPIRNLSQLSYLDVSNTPLYETGFFNSEKVDNMEILKNLNSKNLKTLYISGTYITDFSKISGLSWNAKSGF